MASSFGLPVDGRIVYVRLFSAIALIILVIACINFMNLSTARASKRVKEVGLKKALGVDRKALIFQFLTESVLMAFLSLILAVSLVAIFLPQFNEITGKQLAPDFDIFLISSVLAVTLMTGLVSGSYPAFYLSGFDPAGVWKDQCFHRRIMGTKRIGSLSIYLVRHNDSIGAGGL